MPFFVYNSRRTTEKTKMRNELIKDLKLAGEMGLPVTAIYLDWEMEVGVGAITSIEEFDEGYVFIIGGKEFTLYTTGVFCVVEGEKKYYRLTSAYSKWDLIIIL